MDQHIDEIDDGTGHVGYREAFDLVCSNVRLLPSEKIALELSHNRIASDDAVALASYPSLDVSLKDGFAVKSTDVAKASKQRPVILEVIASVFAGLAFDGEVKPGSAVKICSGAPIPTGAEAVVSGELCREVSKEEVQVRADAEKGRNILKAGEEIKAGATVVRRGGVFLPGNMGLAAAAGISKVNVYRRPKVAIVGIGDEIVAAGGYLRPGQIYASNLITLKAWFDSFSIECVTSVIRDDAGAIAQELERALSTADVILTSGGAWGSERDLVIGVLGELGWQQVFHHVRMGPGKGISFGIWKDIPVFCLPGGPASNEMAFLQLALPGILRMSGEKRHPLQSVPARLTEDLKSRHRAWTEFRSSMLSRDSEGNHLVGLHRTSSRLQAIAGANSLICIPEGTESLSRDEIVQVQMLLPRLDTKDVFPFTG
jgi:molybdopterin molybdotransferase